MDRKDRSKTKKKSLVKCIFVPSFLSSLATLEVPGHTKSQPAQHRKSFGLTYIWSALLNLKWYFRELPFERYQTGSLSHSGWEGIPETYCIREKTFMIVTWRWDLPVLERVVGSCSDRCWCWESLCWNVDKAVNNLEEHDKLVLGPSWFECLPF